VKHRGKKKAMGIVAVKKQGPLTRICISNKHVYFIRATHAAISSHPPPLPRPQGISFALDPTIPTWKMRSRKVATSPLTLWLGIFRGATNVP